MPNQAYAVLVDLASADLVRVEGMRLRRAFLAVLVLMAALRLSEVTTLLKPPQNVAMY